MSKPKSTDWLAVVISCAAFIVSFISLYFSSLRVSDDLRLVSTTPNVNINSKEKTLLMDRLQRFNFINAGTRSISINSIFINLAQPKTENDILKNGCHGEISIIYYDAKPFVVRAGEILTKETRLLARTTDLKENRNAASQELPSITIPIQGINKSRSDARYKICLFISLTTPDADYLQPAGETEGKVEPDKYPDGYTEYGYLGEQQRPIQILKIKTSMYSPLVEFFSDLRN